MCLEITVINAPVIVIVAIINIVLPMFVPTYLIVQVDMLHIHVLVLLKSQQIVVAHVPKFRMDVVVDSRKRNIPRDLLILVGAAAGRVIAHVTAIKIRKMLRLQILKFLFPNYNLGSLLFWF